MEAYDQRYDVAVCSTVERPEFLLYVILFGVIVKKTLILFLRLLWRHLFPKRRDRVSSTRGSSLLRVDFSFRLSPYVIQVILGAVSVVGTVPALVRKKILCVCAK